MRGCLLFPLLSISLFDGLRTGWVARTNGWTKSRYFPGQYVIRRFIVEFSHDDKEWVCLLYSAGAGSVDNGTVAIGLDGQSLDHWRGIVWDPGIVGQQCLHGCYDCLRLIALFRAVMLLVHDWAEWSVWTDTKSGYCRTIAWELGYMAICDVDRLSDQNAWRIKEFKVVVITDGDGNNRLQRCACVCGTSLGVLSAGKIPIMVIGRIGGGGGPVGHFDWLRECGAVVVWPGGESGSAI